MGKPDFSHLKKAEVDGERDRPYRLTVLEGAPTIWFRPALNQNGEFLNHTLRLSNEKAEGGRRGGLSADGVEAAREEDRQVLAHSCATRWDVKDAAGKEVEFSADNCLEYFRALPDWIFDGIRGWASNPINWMRGDPAKLGEH